MPLKSKTSVLKHCTGVRSITTRWPSTNGSQEASICTKLILSSMRHPEISHSITRKLTECCTNTNTVIHEIDWIENKMRQIQIEIFPVIHVLFHIWSNLIAFSMIASVDEERVPVLIVTHATNQCYMKISRSLVADFPMRCDAFCFISSNKIQEWKTKRLYIIRLLVGSLFSACKSDKPCVNQHHPFTSNLMNKSTVCHVLFICPATWRMFLPLAPSRISCSNFYFRL